MVKGEILIGLAIYWFILAKFVFDGRRIFDNIGIDLIFVESCVIERSTVLGELRRLVLRSGLNGECIQNAAKMGIEAEHDDIVVKVDGSEVKLFSDLAYFSGWKAESFFEGTFAIVFTKCILIALVKVLDADASKMAFFEDAILDAIFSVEPTNPLQCVA